MSSGASRFGACAPSENRWTDLSGRETTNRGRELAIVRCPIPGLAHELRLIGGRQLGRPPDDDVGRAELDGRLRDRVEDVGRRHDEQLDRPPCRSAIATTLVNSTCS